MFSWDNKEEHSKRPSATQILVTSPHKSHNTKPTTSHDTKSPTTKLPINNCGNISPIHYNSQNFAEQGVPN